WPRTGDLAGKLLRLRCERNSQFGPLVELHQEEFILRIRCLEKSSCGVSRHPHFVSHAAAAIEEQPNGERSIVLCERHDLLWNVVFKELEVVAGKRSDGKSERGSYVDGNGHQRDRAANLNRGHAG